MERTVYLDNAATTPVRPEVREAMAPFLGEAMFGNPSSPHRYGRAARAAVEKARRRIANALGAEPHDVVFTSGGTEADNLAVIGSALAARNRGRPFRVAVSSIEHKAVLEAARAVEFLGGEAIYLPVDANGNVEPDTVDRALEQDVAALSVMWVNNEIGTVQDVASIAQRCAARNTHFHTDAVQALGKLPCSMTGLPFTCLTITAHKIAGPKGIGALIAPRQDAIQPLLHGGGQESGIRSGTENVAGAVALSVAVELAVQERDAYATKTQKLRDDLECRLLASISDAQIVPNRGKRAPHISNMVFPGTDSGSLIMHLDLAGICCSSGAACGSGSFEASHVHTALGIPVELGISALRFSFSHSNTSEDVDRVVAVMPEIVAKVRALTRTLKV